MPTGKLTARTVHGGMIQNLSRWKTSALLELPTYEIFKAVRRKGRRKIIKREKECTSLSSKPTTRKAETHAPTLTIRT